MKMKDIAMKASGLGALKKVGDMLMKAGGKLRMVTNEKGEKGPFYAADGKGKMKKGGKVKKKKKTYGGMAKEIKRIDILMNRTREEYVTRTEVREDMSRVMEALHRVEDKLDRALSK